MSIRRLAWSLVVLLVPCVLAARPAGCSGLDDWAKARREAANASTASAPAAWGKSAFDNLTLSDYYTTLSTLVARVQVEVACRRWFSAKRDSSAAMGAVHGFIATGQNDSAAVWAARDPALTVYRRFATAQARKQTFSFADALTNGPGSASKDCLLLALWSGAGRETIDALLQRIKGSAKVPGEVVGFLIAFASRDTVGVVAGLEQLEARLAAPSGLEGSVLDRFGDPLIYWVMGQAHALLAVSACAHALAGPDSSNASQWHFFKGRALYVVREYESAAAEFAAATDPLDAGPSDAYMAGIAYQTGGEKAARGWVQKCLAAAGTEEDGASLIALGHVQCRLGATDWPTVKAARAMIGRYHGVARKTHAPYWVLGLLAEATSLDSSKEMFLKAGDGRYPYPGEGFARSFCIDYLDMSVLRGLDQSFAPDLFFGYGGLDKFIEVAPATRSAVEGLRWLLLDLYPEDGRLK